MEERIDDIESLSGEEYIIVSKTRQDILNDVEFENEDECIVCDSIIENIEKQAAATIRNLKVAQLPFIGCIRINPVRRKLRNSKLHLAIVRNNTTKAEYKQYVKDIVAEFRKESEVADREKLFMTKLRRNNKKKYDSLYKRFGRAYAEMFLYSIRLLTVVEYDEEFEEYYRELSAKDRDEEN